MGAISTAMQKGERGGYCDCLSNSYDKAILLAAGNTYHNTIILHLFEKVYDRHDHTTLQLFQKSIRQNDDSCSPHLHHVFIMYSYCINSISHEYKIKRVDS